VPDGAPRLHGDTEDHHGDHDGDEWIASVEPDGDDDRARHDAEADVRVGACVLSVRDDNTHDRACAEEEFTVSSIGLASILAPELIS
jgi:hypothetical protein